MEQDAKKKRIHFNDARISKTSQNPLPASEHPKICLAVVSCILSSNDGLRVKYGSRKVFESECIQTTYIYHDDTFLNDFWNTFTLSSSNELMQA